ncbi:unnamed protein product [Urochloa humidicola]
MPPLPPPPPSRWRAASGAASAHGGHGRRRRRAGERCSSSAVSDIGSCCGSYPLRPRLRGMRKMEWVLPLAMLASSDVHLFC